uniref:WAP domain-containing protein n=1 Tax=Chrysemys picta bellii TaxID=8478 RepID=A0A8C3IXS6_CHRPI
VLVPEARHLPPDRRDNVRFPLVQVLVRRGQGVCRGPEVLDPTQRRSNQCLDDHVCERHEKCCETGCRRECSEDKSGDGTTGPCVDECRADEECPKGQRCRSNGCGRVSHSCETPTPEHHKTEPRQRAPGLAGLS